MTLILWDIDGTLVRSNGGRVAVKAFLRALQAASNHPEELPYPQDSGGKTDQQLALEMLASASISEADAISILPAFGEQYLAELRTNRDSLLEDLRVLPGVREVLASLQQQNVTQSLLTGNLEPVARLKLGCVQLDQYLSFELGAYGSDHHDRTFLVPIVHERVKQHLGYRLKAEQLVVVGDTPRDIACARAGGAIAVVVATGKYSREELEAHAPDALLDDLSDTQAVVETLLRYSTSSETSSTATRALIV